MLTILTLRRLSPLLLGLTLVNGQAQNLVAPDAGAFRQQVEQKRDFASPSTAQPPTAGSAEYPGDGDHVGGQGFPVRRTSPTVDRGS
jgi:hypothetical protein